MERHIDSLYPVILAGGRGTRFWPLSRRDMPKPFLHPDGGPTLLERTWHRATLLAPPARILVSAERRLAGKVRTTLPALLEENLLLEPTGRNTGPALVYAAWRLSQRDPEAVLAVLPADHLIGDESRFHVAMISAAAAARDSDALVCLGVPPTEPSTAFGYVKTVGPTPAHGEPAPIARFVEKPDPESAARLIAEGNCLWNAGIFAWTASRFLAEVDRVAPELAAPLQALRDGGGVAGFFREAPAIPVDRAVMERTDRAHVVAANMDWDDLGTWEALARHLPCDDNGNTGSGPRITIDAQGCLVHSPNKPVALLGVDGLIIVECDDVLLVAGRASAQKVRELPDLMSQRGFRDRT